MADGNAADGKTISFSVKSSSDQKFSITVPDSMTVADLKVKLSTSEYADLPAERQRLIYSGRVLKDADVLSVYNIKDGNTVHMVKGAASAQRPTSGSQSTASSGATAQQNPAAAGVPQNIAAGTGGDPLSNLTGARYAGFAQMPGANAFGPDGGMGPPPGPEDMLSMLDNPMFQSQMNEAMNNPDVIRMMTNNPMVQQNPFLRNALQDPNFRRMLMDPQVIRSSMQMSQMMGGQGLGQAAMPAPGLTDTTPQRQGQDTAGNVSQPPDQQASSNTTSPPAFNPFQFMGQGQGQGQGQNPFAALFGAQGWPGGAGNPPFGSPATSNPSNTAGQNQTQNSQQQQQQQQQQSNPFANLFGGGIPGGQQQTQGNPFNNMMQTMLSNPAMMQAAMQDMQNMQGGGNPNQGQGQQQGGFNPFAFMGQGGFGSQAAPQDSRPPEEQYAEQLRQLNDMGFFEFDRNIRALRMAGGSVQGAIEMLLSGGV